MVIGWGDDEAVQLAEVPLCTSATKLIDRKPSRRRGRDLEANSSSTTTRLATRARWPSRRRLGRARCRSSGPRPRQQPDWRRGRGGLAEAFGKGALPKGCASAGAGRERLSRGPLQGIVCPITLVRSHSSNPNTSSSRSPNNDTHTQARDAFLTTLNRTQASTVWSQIIPLRPYRAPLILPGALLCPDVPFRARERAPSSRELLQDPSHASVPSDRPSRAYQLVCGVTGPHCDLCSVLLWCCVGSRRHSPSNQPGFSGSLLPTSICWESCCEVT